MAGNSGDDQVVFLSINETPIRFQEDWGTGIGGGLWSTGLAMAKYFERHHSDVSANLKQLAEIKRTEGEDDSISAIELGSGNGFLSVCLLALAQESSLSLKNVVVTDMEDHLGLMEDTIRANCHVWKELNVRREGSSSKFYGTTSSTQIVDVAEYEWGISDFDEKYDLIFGSDLAYRDELHDPLISSLEQLSHKHTVCLIGVTMNDTRPVFFDKLSIAGFQYERLADHYLEGQFRGGNFGIFVITRR